MITDVIQIVLGSFVALFLPGFIIVLMFFDEFKILEKIVFSIAFSIMFDVGIAIYLGYNETQALRTGGLTFNNIVKIEIIVITFLLISYLLTYLLKKYLYKKEHTTKKNVKATKNKRR